MTSVAKRYIPDIIPRSAVTTGSADRRNNRPKVTRWWACVWTLDKNVLNVNLEICIEDPAVWFVKYSTDMKYEFIDMTQKILIDLILIITCEF
jgi:hypothetical protein